MLLSTSHMVEGESYILSGGNHYVTFVNWDIGNLLQIILLVESVPQQNHGLSTTLLLHYSISPCHKPHPYPTTALFPELKLEQLHCSLGHLNHQSHSSQGFNQLSKQELSTSPMYASHVKWQSNTTGLRTAVQIVPKAQEPQSPCVDWGGLLEYTPHLFPNG